MTADSRRLLREAERCFRLANGIAGARLSEELEAIGREFEREARQLARASGANSPVALHPDAPRNRVFDLDQR